jgi:plastocyanin
MRSRTALVLALLAFSAIPGTATAADQTVTAVATTAWQPPNVSINVHDRVTWTNPTAFEHTVKCTSASAGSCWNEKALHPGGSVPITFTKAAVYQYECGIHSAMKGSVTVTGGTVTTPPVTTPPPTKSPTPKPTTPSPKPTTTTPRPTPTPTTKSPTPTPTPTSATPTPTPTSPDPTASETATPEPTESATLIADPPTKKTSGGLSGGVLVWLLIGLAVVLGLGGVAGLYFTRAPKAPQ